MRILVLVFGAEDIGWAGLRGSFVLHPPPTFPLKNLLLLQITFYFCRIKCTDSMAWTVSGEYSEQPCGKLMFRDQLTCHTRSTVIFNEVMADLPQYDRRIPFLSGGKLTWSKRYRKRTSEKQTLGLWRKAAFLLPLLHKLIEMILITKTISMGWCDSLHSDFSAMWGLRQDVHVSLWVSWDSPWPGQFWTG